MNDKKEEFEMFYKKIEKDINEKDYERLVEEFLADSGEDKWHLLQ